MIKKTLSHLLTFLFRAILSLRYKVEVRGKEKLNPKYLNKSGGVLFLPNHPAALIDPALITLAVFPRFPIRPLVIEYMYFTPIVHSIMKHLNALPVPNFESSNNSLKRKRYQRVLGEVVKGLKTGQNFLLYPAGRLKHTHLEKIGGASATREIIKQTPEANIVLVRIKGLWGSSFSRALTGNVPPLFPTFKKAFWILLKNFFFFAPRRYIVIEFEPAPANFPYHANRIELNRWLEQWYNRPDELTQQEGTHPGDSLILVSNKFWKKEIPQPFILPKEEGLTVTHLADVDYEIQDKVFSKLADLTELDISSIHPRMSLSSDLGLDSLDISELAMFLQDRFNISSIPIIELTTVERTLAIAAKQITFKDEEEEITVDKKWLVPNQMTRAYTEKGETLIEVFLNACTKWKNAPAYADSRSGVLTYNRLKLATCLLAEKIKHLPGKYIGVLLPASVGAFVSVFAILLAGKIPLMINWTVGSRHLQAIQDLSHVECVLSSWAFLEKLDAVNLDGIEDKLIMLETMRREFSLFDKLKALARSKKSTSSLLKTFNINHIKKDDPAVLLFTSGTESLPKGVLLSNDNILSNHRAGLKTVNIYANDVLLAFLPPFHSFGFCIAGLLGVLAGVRTAFYPNPIDGKGLAKSFEIWKGTITCGAPTFIKGFLKAAGLHQLDSMRLCITGAERTPDELIQLINQLGKQGCLLEGYGITECSPIISANIPGEPLRGVGKPIEGVEVIIIQTETHEKLSANEEGLILVRGPSVFHGYLNPGIASPFLMIEDKEWYNTGDIGYLDNEGYLTITGRKKRFLKAGGEMISLQAIETALLQTPQVKAQLSQTEEGPPLGVIGEERPGSKPYLAIVTTFDLDVNEANQILRESGFSNLTRISEVIKIEKIPLMGTGKTNYRFLEEQHLK